MSHSTSTSCSSVETVFNAKEGRFQRSTFTSSSSGTLQNNSRPKSAIVVRVPDRFKVLLLLLHHHLLLAAALSWKPLVF